MLRSQQKRQTNMVRFIQADRTYIISCFRVCNAKDAFRSIPGPYMLEFTYHTKISAATEEITEPKYIYNLTPFSKLPEFINDKKIPW